MGPRIVQRNLADITGYIEMPPAYSLGFHFSKWQDKLTAETIIQRNKDFTLHEFQTDVLWMDIDHTNHNKYFAFDPERFPDE